MLGLAKFRNLFDAMYRLVGFRANIKKQSQLELQIVDETEKPQYRLVPGPIEFVFNTVRQFGQTIKDYKRKQKHSHRFVHLLTEGFELEERVVPADLYVWDSGATNISLHQPAKSTAWGGYQDVNNGDGTHTYYSNWWDLTTSKQAQVTNATGNPSGCVPGKITGSDQVEFLNGNSSVNCTLYKATSSAGAGTGDLSVGGLTMGGTGSATYTGTLTLKAKLTDSTTFIQNSGTITIDNGNTNSPGLTLAGINSGDILGGTIGDSASSNNYLKIDGSSSASTILISNNSSNTTAFILTADMHIVGASSSVKATVDLGDSTHMTTNMTLGVPNTIYIDGHGVFNLQAINNSTTSDTQGGITGLTSSSSYGIELTDATSLLSRGFTGDHSDSGSVLLDRPVWNDDGTVDIYSGDRLDISGRDGFGSAYHQTGSAALLEITEGDDKSGNEFVGTLQTATKNGVVGNGTTYGSIDISGGEMTLECFNPGSAHQPAYDSIIMGPLGNFTVATKGTLTIGNGCQLNVTANGSARSSYTTVFMIGNLTFADGSAYHTDAWAGSTPIMCKLVIDAYTGSTATYVISISSTSTTCTLIDQNMTAWTNGTSDYILYNATTGGQSGSFGLTEDNAGTPHTFTDSWSGTKLVATA